VAEPDRTRRVLLLTHSYAPERTPPARRWEAIVAELVDLGWQVCVLAPPAGTRGTGRSTGGQGERILTTWGPGRTAAGRNGRFVDAVLHALQCVPAGLAGHRPDVIVATVPALPTVVPGRLLGFLLQRPVVVEMRDAWPDLARDAGLRTGPLGRIMERIVGGAQASADLVVTVTEGFAEILRARGVGPVETLCNGVRLDSVPLLPPRTRHAGELNVLYLGNHGESQGLERLVDAAALLRQSAPGIRVRLVGDGTRRGALLELNDRLGGAAELLPAVHGSQAQEHYRWADTVLVPLRPDWPSFRHTVPSKTYELLGIGRHVTAQVEGEGADIVAAAHAGDVVGPTVADLVAHLERLAADPASTAPDGRARRWVAEHADLSAIGRRYSDLLGRLVRR
jgi:glycosyltransferase involved in cell wall biosynthesis